jgi:hypothetical protein
MFRRVTKRAWRSTRRMPVIGASTGSMQSLETGSCIALDFAYSDAME